MVGKIGIEFHLVKYIINRVSNANIKSLYEPVKCYGFLLINHSNALVIYCSHVLCHMHSYEMNAVVYFGSYFLFSVGTIE